MKHEIDAFLLCFSIFIFVFFSLGLPLTGLACLHGYALTKTIIHHFIIGILGAVGLKKAIYYINPPPPPPPPP